MEMLSRMETGRFKVFKDSHDWLYGGTPSKPKSRPLRIGMTGALTGRPAWSSALCPRPVDSTPAGRGALTRSASPVRVAKKPRWARGRAGDGNSSPPLS